MSNLTPETLAELRGLVAESPTPLPWHVWDRGIGWEVHPGADSACLSEYGVNMEGCPPVNSGQRDTFSRPDAELIVATVNALPDLLDAVAERDALAASVARVRALHKLDHYLGEPGDGDCPHDEDYDGPRHFENEDGMWLCEDTPGEEVICGGCPADEEGERVPWPCPTIRALDGTP